MLSQIYNDIAGPDREPTRADIYESLQAEYSFLPNLAEKNAKLAFLRSDQGQHYINRLYAKQRYEWQQHRKQQMQADLLASAGQAEEPSWSENIAAQMTESYHALTDKVVELGVDAAMGGYELYQERKAAQAAKAFAEAELERAVAVSRKQAWHQENAWARQDQLEASRQATMDWQDRDYAQRISALKDKWGIPASQQLTDEQEMSLIETDEGVEREARLAAYNNRSRPNAGVPVELLREDLAQRHQGQTWTSRSDLRGLDQDQQDAYWQKLDDSGVQPTVYRSNDNNVLMQPTRFPGEGPNREVRDTYHLMTLADQLDRAKRSGNQAELANVLQGMAAQGIDWV